MGSKDIWTSVEPAARHVFEDLGLTEYFPSKITIQKARELIRSDVTKKSDIPWSFLEKVLGLGYKGRGDFFQVHKAPLLNRKTSLMGTVEEFNWDEGGCTEEGETYSYQDVYVAVFLCCDNICKKLLAQKLHMCHLSIPLVLPDITDKTKLVMQLWALRGLTDDIGFDMHIPIVSFLAVNGQSVVKTRILNTLLSDESFDTFFDRELEKSRLNGAKVKKVFWRSLVDAACFQPSKCVCPSAETCSCTFKKLLMFLNLRGICGNFKTELDLVCKISTLVVIVVDAGQTQCSTLNDNIKKIIDQSKQALIVFTKSETSSLHDCKLGFLQVQEVVRSTRKNGGKNTQVQFHFDHKTGSVFHTERTRRDMKQMINEIIEAKDVDSISLKELFEQVTITNVITDEDGTECSSGRKKAEEILAKVKKYDIIDIKEKVLPLQSVDLWHKWSEIERRMKSEIPEDNESHDQFVARLHDEQKTLREKQTATYIDASNETMQSFCSTIVSLEGGFRRYFIEWLSIFLGEISSERTERIYTKVLSLRKSPKANQLKRINSRESPNDDSSFKRQSKQLEEEKRNASFDIEQFFREVGQVYEAFNVVKTSSNIRIPKDFSEEQLSMVIAELFVEGMPLEVLDCKARQIPIQFVRSVFSYVKGMVSGKVFILSVIGIQSSGKSTLLNALFGTQFSTSVGLCTEGVNAQLIPMPTHIHSREYKYIMLIDTKGLRSTDNDAIRYDAFSRDNELATLLFGISDLTLINMKGESKAEIDNILQIVVHALLNIKAVNKGLRLESKCLFIHHNVDASGAKEKLTMDDMMFQEKLDNVTSGVAERLGVSDVKRFSDIIKFDVDDIKYFPNLWRGNPPMASINIGYSAKVREVKHLILKEIISNHQHLKLDIEKFSMRLKDIWDAIQSEDFVFCFRNHIEINAHTHLEGFFNNLRWDLNKTAITTLRKMKKHSDEEETMVNEITSKMEKAYDTAKIKLQDFFQTTEDGVLLREWNVHYDKTLQKVKDEKIASSKTLLSAEMEIQRVQKDTFLRLEEWKKQARMKAIDCARAKLIVQKEKKELVYFNEELTKLPKEEEIKRNFKDLWRDLKSAITPPDSNENAESVMRNGLRDMGGLHVSQTEAIYFDRALADDFKIQENHFHKRGKTSTGSNEFQKINEINNEVTCNIIKEVEKYTDDIKGDIFGRPHVEQTVKIVLDNITKWNNENQEIQLTRQYKIDILIYVARLALPSFKKMQEAYRNKIDVTRELEEFKVEIETRFMDTIKQIDQERTEATLFCNELIRLIKEKVDRELVEILPDEIKEGNYIMKSKKEFLSKILMDLLKEDSFNSYMEFLDHTSEFFAKSLRKYINEYLFDQKVFSQHAIRKSEIITSRVSEIIKRNASPLMESNDLMTWMETLQKLAGILPKIRESTKHVMDSFVQNNVNANMFYNYLASSVEKIPNILRDTYNKMTKLNIKCDQQIFAQLLEHVQGCQKKCPFCQVLCTSTVPGHEQECRNPHHYPIGIQGYKNKQNKLDIATCNSLVASSEKFRLEGGRLKVSVGRKIINFIYHRNTNYNQDIVLFRKYKKVYKDWDIEVNKSFHGSLYWKRLFAKFKEELSARYGIEAPEIPHEWSDIKKEEAISSLD